MKTVIIIFALTSLASCKKMGTGFECQCTDHPDRHYDEKYEMAEGLCQQRAVDLSATEAKPISCHIR